MDELKKINLGTCEDSKPVFVSALLTLEKLVQYEEIFRGYKDVFAYNYLYMLGWDPNIVVRYLVLFEKKPYVKWCQWRFQLELVAQIEAEVDKTTNLASSGKWSIIPS